jgi:hypothetical protein
MQTVFNQNRAWKQFESWLAKCLENNLIGEMTVTMEYNTSQDAPQRDIPTNIKVQIIFSYASSGGIADSKSFTFANSATQPITVSVNTPCPGSVLSR